MTKARRISYAVMWVLVALLLVGFLYLFAAVHSLREYIDYIESRVDLARVVTYGRTKGEVEEWLGPPDSLYPLRQGMAGSIMVYRSVGPVGGGLKLRYRRMNRLTDVYIVLNDKERVVAVYYPDYSHDRVLLDRLQGRGME